MSNFNISLGSLFDSHTPIEKYYFPLFQGGIIKLLWFQYHYNEAKKKSIQYHTEQSISHLYSSNITPVNENPFFFSLLLEFHEHLFIQMKMEYMVGYIPPSIFRYYKCNARDCSLSLWERISNFFFFCVKKCLRGVWNEEKSIVV